jgi:hypothetical protein
MIYKAPAVVDYGSIVSHTFTVGPQDNVKGGGPQFHLDKFCEQSGFTGTDPGDLCPTD